MASDAKDVSAEPAENQAITHNGKLYTTVKEGLAYILVPEEAVEAASQAKGGAEGIQHVFYNPIQQFNRDLSVLGIKAFAQERAEQRQAANLEKRGRNAEKKRKRHDQRDHGDRPDKQQKVGGAEQSEEAVAGATAEAPGADTNPEVPSATEAPLLREAEETGESTTIADEGKTNSADNGVAPLQGDRPQAEGDKSQSGPKFTILDALSATGLRALRYVQEIPEVTSVTSNDLLATAVESIKLNVEHNKLESKIHVSHDDAIAHMYTVVANEMRRGKGYGKPNKSEKYDVIDLDPYGTAAPFLDAAVQAVRDDGGLLCVTCTDSGVWASNGYPEKAYSLYGGVPMKGFHSHEAGLRIILHAIETSAARYGLAIEPLLSLSIDFYVRLFVRIKRSPASVKFQGGKNMIVYNCDAGCGAWTTQLLMKNKSVTNKKGSGSNWKHGFATGPTTDQNCAHCGLHMHIAGPMYAGRLHSPAFIKRILAEVEDVPTEVYATASRIRGMLQTALEEMLLTPEEEAAQKESAQEHAEPGSEEKANQKARAQEVREAELAAIDPYPFYFFPGPTSGVLHCHTPPDNALRGALIGLGYRVTRSHCKPGSIKTDAPWSVIWRVMREWVRQRAPIKEESLKPGSAGARILGLDKKRAAGSAAVDVDDGAAADKAEPEVVFDEKLGRDPDKDKFVRYQINPRKHWGPMSRANGKGKRAVD